MKLRTLKSDLRKAAPTLKPLAAASSASWHNWYAHRAWRRRRAQQFNAEPLCRLCFAIDGRITEATVADHITPHRGDRTAFFGGALASLCKPCHDSRKKAMENAGDYSLPGPATPRHRPLVR